MDGTWKVFWGAQPVGRCTARREGLYTRFSCRCSLPDGQLRNLVVKLGPWERSLGVLAPSDGGYGLETRVATRHLPPGEPEFSARLRREKGEGTFVPLYPEEPFSYLHRLESAFLARKDGKLGIILKDTPAGSELPAGSPPDPGP